MILFCRVQNLDSIVKPDDRELPITNLKGDVLFNSWNSIFSSSGGFFSQVPRIYSFSGKNILNDATWPHKTVWQGANSINSIDSNCDGKFLQFTLVFSTNFMNFFQDGMSARVIKSDLVAVCSVTNYSIRKCTAANRKILFFVLRC